MNVLMERVGRLAIGVHGKSDPTDKEWDAWLSLCQEAGPELVVLVMSYGGSPNVSQRSRMDEGLKGVKPPSSIMVASKLTRMVVTAVSWIGIPTKAFDMDEFQAACDYIQLSSQERREAKDILDRLVSEIMNPDVSARPSA